MLDALLDWLAALPRGGTYAALAFISALENVFPPVPADVAVALGAFLAHRGEVSPVPLGVLCWAANLASAAFTYALGRRYGEELLSRRWARPFLPPDAVATVRQAALRHGAFGIFVTRLFPGVRAAVPPFAGILGLSPLTALVPTALCSAIWYAMLIAAGSALGLQWEAVRSLVESVTGSLGLLGLLALAAFAVWLWRLRRRSPRA